MARLPASKVVIERVQDPDSPDLLLALKLYRRRIPEEEGDPAEDIVRWIQEAKDEARQGIAVNNDFFLIAKIGSTVCALIYFHYSPTAKWAFMSYLVVDDMFPLAQHYQVSTTLLREFRRMLVEDLPGCRGFVTEVDPRHYTKIKGRHNKVRDATIKIVYFQKLAQKVGFELRALGDVPYTQPDLSPSTDVGAERPMLLMYARVGAQQNVGDLMCEEVEQILSFIYDDVYREDFCHDEALDKKYQAYTHRLKERVISSYKLRKIPLKDCDMGDPQISSASTPLLRYREY